MFRSIARLFPPYAPRSVRVTVDWRKGRIRNIKVEYGKHHVVHRWLGSLRW